MKIEKASDK